MLLFPEDLNLGACGTNRNVAGPHGSKLLVASIDSQNTIKGSFQIGSREFGQDGK
jgi:hypothetical protein